MIISDLNYLENTSEEVLGGTLGGPFPSYYENVGIFKSINVGVSIYGNAATANAGASAYGANTVTQTATFSGTSDYSSSSSSASVAATGASYYYLH